MNVNKTVTRKEQNIQIKKGTHTKSSGTQNRVY
jgi:hypothetical protein